MHRRHARGDGARHRGRLRRPAAVRRRDRRRAGPRPLIGRLGYGELRVRSGKDTQRLLRRRRLRPSRRQRRLGAHQPGHTGEGCRCRRRRRITSRLAHEPARRPRGNGHPRAPDSAGPRSIARRGTSVSVSLLTRKTCAASGDYHNDVAAFRAIRTLALLAKGCRHVAHLEGGASDRGLAIPVLSSVRMAGDHNTGDRCISPRVFLGKLGACVSR